MASYPGLSVSPEVRGSTGPSTLLTAQGWVGTLRASSQQLDLAQDKDSVEDCQVRVHCNYMGEYVYIYSVNLGSHQVLQCMSSLSLLYSSAYYPGTHQVQCSSEYGCKSL